MNTSYTNVRWWYYGTNTNFAHQRMQHQRCKLPEERNMLIGMMYGFKQFSVVLEGIK